MCDGQDFLYSLNAKQPWDHGIEEVPRRADRRHQRRNPADTAKSAKAATPTHISLSARRRAFDPTSTTATQTSQPRRSMLDRLRGSIGTHPDYVHPAWPVSHASGLAPVARQSRRSLARM
jgi:hypothetical protein